MPAFVIGHIRVRDAAAWDEYVAEVGATIAMHGGEVQFRGRKSEAFAGEHPFDKVVVIRFDDADAARRWHASAEYQRLVPIRERAADVTLISYNA